MTISYWGSVTRFKKKMSEKDSDLCFLLRVFGSDDKYSVDQKAQLAYTVWEGNNKPN